MPCFAEVSSPPQKQDISKQQIPQIRPPEGADLGFKGSDYHWGLLAATYSLS